ncbi:MAG: hypothetical protein WBC91_13180 [Phototrophicaceae bacterium]
MNFEQLITLLNHPKPRARLVAIHTIDLVDEVRALDAISARVPIETERILDDTLKTVGRRLMSLKKEGYDTITALCEHFDVYNEILSYADDTEFSRIQKMVQQTADKRKNDDFNNRMVNMASMAIASRAMGVGGVMGVSTNTSGILSDVTQSKDSIRRQKKRARPMIPTETDISRWIHLLKSDDAEQRQQALIQLHSAHNPNGLQYMAYTYYQDDNPKVRETAKRLGRSLYWNQLYYDLEKSGEIKTIIEEFANSLGVTVPEQVDMKLTTGTHQSLEDILASAEKARKKRGLKR